MDYRFSILIFCGLFGMNTLYPQDLPDEVISYADWVLYDGSVITVDEQDRVAEAIAVRDGKVMAVGTKDHILRMAGPETRKINLAKKAVMPGIINTHIHPNRSALRNYSRDLPPDQRRRLSNVAGVISDWTDKAQVLAQIKRIVEGADPQMEWIAITGQNRGGVSRFDVTELRGQRAPVNEEILRQERSSKLLSDFFRLNLTRYDLDRISPDRYLAISFVGWYGILNSKAVEYLLETYGEDCPGFFKDENGIPNGIVKDAPIYIIREEILPKAPLEAYAYMFKKELAEQIAPKGFTTISTRLLGLEISAYALLDTQGELPVRVAYGHEVGRNNPFFDRDIRRMGIWQGHGSDMLWMSGVSVGPPDGAPNQAGTICSSYMRRVKPESDFFDQVCRWDNLGAQDREIVAKLNRLGFRISNIHSYGDLGLEKAVDVFEQVSDERSILGRRFALDHSQMFNPGLIEKSGRLQMYWSLSPSMLAGARTQYVERVFGIEVANNMMAPVKSLLDAGAKVTYEGESRNESPFAGLEVLVTRVD
ncbi:amidohydrolase family protein, partial [Acidobacteria bacterium AH-259-D05]|nr:amidohydrolase family protein [Acidobacteria bacterium AH-259-D05]